MNKKSIFILGLLFAAMDVSAQTYDPRLSNLSPVIRNLIKNMVEVEGGTYTMGATLDQGNGLYPEEKLAHKVAVSSFSIGRYEVTQEEWEVVMGNNPSESKGARLPVDMVSWDDCQAFIRSLNIMTGMTFRLPTEAEWEYAARGGRKSCGFRYPGGNNLASVAWYNWNANGKGKLNASHGIHQVGAKKPNELGLYDMAGNVREWCQDRFYVNYYRNSPKSDPGKETHEKYPTNVSRGGCWFSEADECRVAHRNINIWIGYEGHGLRLVLASPSQDDGSIKPALRLVIENLINNMVNVDGGTFTMGATEEQGGDVYDAEKPAHQVTLSSFSIGRYEVTQEEWEAVMGTNPSSFKGGRHPVEKVSWDECQGFVLKLNELTRNCPGGGHFRLPTEAEWEYAARGGRNSRGYKYAGGNDLDSVAWHDGNSGNETHDVGLKVPNELGLYDMSGNVWEWCHDCYDKDYYSNSPSSDPCNNTVGPKRIDRGGGWFNYLRECRVASRRAGDPCDHYGARGLRLAR